MWTPTNLTDRATGQGIETADGEQGLILSGSFLFGGLRARRPLQIPPAWSTSAVLRVRPDLTVEQAEAVLQSVLENSDADTYLVDDTLEMWASSLYPAKNRVDCLNCGHRFVLASDERNYLGWHTLCPKCGVSFDADLIDGPDEKGEADD
jgi:hypothetical protein